MFELLGIKSSLGERYDLKDKKGKRELSLGRWGIWLGVFGAVFFLTSCGYTLRHRLKKAFLNPKGIFVPVFDNATDETGAERVFTNALIRELQSRHEFVVTSREKAGVELRGALTEVSYGPTAYTGLGFRGLQSYRRLPTEAAVSVRMYLQLIDVKSSRKLWDKYFRGFRRFNAPIDRTFDFEAPSSLGLRTQAIAESVYDNIARDIMRDVYDEIVDSFGVESDTTEAK